MNPSQTQTLPWQVTACIICSINCGIEIQVEDGCFQRVRGHKEHPVSQGYLCQKSARLDYYQNHDQRLTEPLRKRPDGTFEPIDWETAIQEVAGKLAHIRDTFGGHTIAYYGGGGQGNHLGGAYATSFRAALQTPYIYSSLAQEKTGDFWINGRLFGRQSCHMTEGIAEADYVILIGTNPWQAHGFPRSRDVLRAISKDSNRTLVVIDPRRTRTAEMADIHLQVKPGMDAFLLTAILGVIVQERLVHQGFIQEHTTGYPYLKSVFEKIPVAAYARRAGIDESLVRQVARGLAGARRATTRHDLGVEHSLHSTLNCYLEKLLAFLTGNFGREGSNTLHTQFVPLLGHSDEPEDGGFTSGVTGMKEISKLFPPNILPSEIDSENPNHIRAVFVDSSNPLQSAADTNAYRKAFQKLDLLVAIDVALTETAQIADYILPAPTQYEKWEAAFFSFLFPTNYFHLRRPITPPVGNTLPEPEIYYRLMVALGAIPAEFPELESYARQYRQEPETGLFPVALQMALNEHPKWKPYTPTILYSTLGKALPDGAQAAAVVWGTSQFYANRYAEQVRRAGYEGQGHMLGEALFNSILTSDTAVPISTHTYEEMWDLVRHPDKRVHLEIPEMLEEIADLADEPESPYINDQYPFVLAAGERRSYNANNLYRHPGWRRNDPEGALRIHPKDAANYDLADGGLALIQSAAGAVSVRVQYDDGMHQGFLSMPHGYGIDYPSDDGLPTPIGPKINLLSSADHCDPLAKTPYHKYIPVNLRPLPG